MLTGSPSAVKSEISSLDPSAADVGHPVWIPPPTGIGPLADASGRAAASSRAAPGRDRLRGVVRSGEARDEQPDGLVADELVDHAVVVDDRLGGQPVERAQERGELGRPQPLAEAGRAADVREQQRDLDLGAADALLRQVLHAVLAQLRVALPRAEPGPEHQPADALERRVAQLAARRRRAGPERAPQPSIPCAAGQDRAPLLLGCLVAHARSVGAGRGRASANRDSWHSRGSVASIFNPFRGPPTHDG